jgi:uncharacterized BrkB/YihY/UPF0761 family membrane protein
MRQISQLETFILAGLVTTSAASLFPFLIFVTAMAVFVGSQSLADEVAKLVFSAWPPIVARPIAGKLHDVLAALRGATAHNQRSLGTLFLVWGNRGGTRRSQSRLQLGREPALVAATPRIDRSM